MADLDQREAGKLAALEECLAMVHDRSGTAYVRWRDEVANELRELARAIQQRINEATEAIPP